MPAFFVVIIPLFHALCIVLKIPILCRDNLQRFFPFDKLRVRMTPNVWNLKKVALFIMSLPSLMAWFLVPSKY
jgi:hypothetical protein